MREFIQDISDIDLLLAKNKFVLEDVGNEVWLRTALSWELQS